MAGSRPSAELHLGARGLFDVHQVGRNLALEASWFLPGRAGCEAGVQRVALCLAVACADPADIAPFAVLLDRRVQRGERVHALRGLVGDDDDVGARVALDLDEGVRSPPHIRGGTVLGDDPLGAGGDSLV